MRISDFQGRQAHLEKNGCVARVSGEYRSLKIPSDLLRYHILLMGPELGVVTVLGDEAFMSAAFDDFAAFEDDDLIGSADGGQAVCDDDHRAVCHEVVERFLDLAFGDGVDRRGRLV